MNLPKIKNLPRKETELELFVRVWQDDGPWQGDFWQRKYLLLITKNIVSQNILGCKQLFRMSTFRTACRIQVNRQPLSHNKSWTFEAQQSFYNANSGLHLLPYSCTLPEWVQMRCYGLLNDTCSKTYSSCLCLLFLEPIITGLPLFPA